MINNICVVVGANIIKGVKSGRKELMTKVGLNVLFSINQSVSYHNIMLLLPYVSQLSNVTSQLKDIYSPGAQLLVMIMMTCGNDLPRRSSYSI